MVEQDTIKLLRECDAGIEMGIESLRRSQKDCRGDDLRRILADSLQKHQDLQREVEAELHSYNDEGKDPNIMAKWMSAIKSKEKMMWEDSDRTVADLITDGANMGVKSLSRYLNQYAAADEKSKDIAKRLIAIEERLGQDVRGYL